MRSKILVRVVLFGLFLLSGCAAAQTGSQNDAPPAQIYIQNKGSDTMVNLALAWAERYQNEHPEVSISVTGGGTGTGITSLIDGTIDIGNASRAVKQEEIDEALKLNTELNQIVVARDAIAVIVHPDNPVNQLTLEQISAIFRGEITNWSEVGGEDRPIVKLSRETNSGTHVYFLERVVRLDSKENKFLFSADTLLLPSSEGIISETAENPNAIGYDGLGYVTPHVKVLAVADTDSDAFILPSVETVNDGSYPISRDLYMITRGTPEGQVKAYIDWILSDDAQQIVTELGFVPVIR